MSRTVPRHRIHLSLVDNRNQRSVGIPHGHSRTQCMTALHSRTVHRHRLLTADIQLLHITWNENKGHHHASSLLYSSSHIFYHHLCAFPPYTPHPHPRPHE